MSRPGEEALEVLRSVWAASGQPDADLDEAELDKAQGGTKGCKRMQDVGFDGLSGAEPGTGPDLRAAWRETLRRDGKLSSDAASVADLISGRAEAS